MPLPMVVDMSDFDACTTASVAMAAFMSFLAALSRQLVVLEGYSAARDEGARSALHKNILKFACIKAVKNLKSTVVPCLFQWL